MTNNSDKKKRIEEIGKENIFHVPDNYFDELPGKIQSNVSQGNNLFARTWFSGRVVYPSFTVVLLLFVGIFFAREFLLPEKLPALTQPVAPQLVVEEYLLTNSYSDEELIQDIVEVQMEETTQNEDYLLEELPPEEIEAVIIEM